MKRYLVLMCCLLLVGCNNSPDKDINSEELDVEDIVMRQEDIVMEQEDQLNENIDSEESDLESNVLYAALDEDEYRFSEIGASKEIIEYGDREIQLLKVEFLAEYEGVEGYVPTINFTLKNIGKKELSYSVEDFRLKTQDAIVEKPENFTDWEGNRPSGKLMPGEVFRGKLEYKQEDLDKTENLLFHSDLARSLNKPEVKFGIWRYPYSQIDFLPGKDLVELGYIVDEFLFWGNTMTVEEVRVTKEDKIEYGAFSSNDEDDIEYNNHKIHVKVKVTGDGRRENRFYTDALSVFSNNGLGNPDEAHQRHYLVSEETDTLMRIPRDGSRIYEMTFFCTQEPVEPILVFGGYRKIEDLDNMGVLKLY